VSANNQPINEPATLRRALLRWYDVHRRDLPWRKTCDPYRIWISEVMLQQTRVAAVLEHYRNFLERFPTVQALAAASLDSVLAAWSGLGYYRRARMLHECAHQIVEQHGGNFPQTSAALLDLPGIGPYTAAAIASIAFSEPVAVVDGNVERVLQRLAGKTLNRRQTWQEAQTLLDTTRPGDFNQAMMELGATVCLPREPHCLACPVSRSCATRGEIRRTRPPIQQQKREIWCALDWNTGNAGQRPGKIRMVRRPEESSLMPGMWELPQLYDAPKPLPAVPPWRTFRHSITVTDYTVHVFLNTPLPEGSPRGPRGSWIAVNRIPQLPITGLARKILKAGGII
jgi:A/G-specific adenine glycosylase